MLPRRMQILIGVLAITAGLGLIMARAVFGRQPPSPPAVAPVSTPLPYREPQSPAISFIDSHSATCSNPSPGTGACYIAWNYLYVTAASGQNVISMTVAIDNRVRAYHAGFFQNAMYIPGDMTAPGYRVTCGKPGSGGAPGWGKTYTYVIRARESGGLSSANYGTVQCPADVVRLNLPVIRRR